MWAVSTAPWVAPLYLPGSHFPFIFSLAPFGHFSFSVCFSVTSSILHCFCFLSPFDLMSSKKQVMGAQTSREREICSFVWAVAWFHNSGHWGIFFFLNSGFRNQEDNYFYKEHWCEMNMSWPILGTLRSVAVMAVLCGAFSRLKMLHLHNLQRSFSS